MNPNKALWGVESNVTERFVAAGALAENISFARETFAFIAPFPSFQLVDMFRKYYGPTMNAFEAAEKNGKETDLQRELETLFDNQNQSADKSMTSVAAIFLKVTVLR